MQSQSKKPNVEAALNQLRLEGHQVCEADVARLSPLIHDPICAAAYRLLDTLPDTKSAMLYSLSAMTSYGHANLFLEKQWQLMGALEALNGMLLFGLTAFLFAMIQKVW